MTATEHTFELPDGTTRVLDTGTRYTPPALVEIDGVRYLVRPKQLGKLGRQPWVCVPL